MQMDDKQCFVREEDGGYIVHREGKALKSPKGAPFLVPSRWLGDAIVVEFSAQSAKLDLRSMPLTQLALTAIDVTGPCRDDVIGGIMHFGQTELICLRSEAPEDLVSEQEKVWDPYLDWCRQRFNACLVCGRGILPFAQDQAALETLRGFVSTLDDFRLTGLSHACGTTGSLVLGLALEQSFAAAQKVLEAAELDRIWQSNKWGSDPVSEARHAEIQADLQICEKWFSALGCA